MGEGDVVVSYLSELFLLLWGEGGAKRRMRGLDFAIFKRPHLRGDTS